MSAIIIPFPNSGRPVAPAQMARRAKRPQERESEAPLSAKEIAAIRNIFLTCPIAKRAIEGFQPVE
jgi:hypothetical protein